ncbi:hypothetical protein EYF80_013448 [Liparis tanakae]|uniref:Uncharacterized protein n=1 Tax=Liparis tanakae TaxID=230148 RepID=A0A4Z2IE50_9TELE|nr:hypothetical protein EYF80_013448 [Liparis tanakae]
MLVWCYLILMLQQSLRQEGHSPRRKQRMFSPPGSGSCGSCEAERGAVLIWADRFCGDGGTGASHPWKAVYVTPCGWSADPRPGAGGFQRGPPVSVGSSQASFEFESTSTILPVTYPRAFKHHAPETLVLMKAAGVWLGSDTRINARLVQRHLTGESRVTGNQTECTLSLILHVLTPLML